MKNNLRKVVLLLLSAAIGVVIGVLAMAAVQTWESRRDFLQTSGDFLSDIESTFQEREQILKGLNSFNDRISTRVVYNLSFLIDDSYDLKDEGQREKLQQEFLPLAAGYGMEELYLTDPEGTVLCAGDPAMCGKKLSDESYFGAENWRKLTEVGSWEDELLGVTVSSGGTERRYYAVGTVSDTGECEYILIGGESTDMSNTIREYLKDISIRFRNLTCYDEIAAFAVNADTGKVICASSGIQDLEGKDITEILSVNLPADADGRVRHIRLQGRNRLLLLRKYESETIGSWYFGTVSLGMSAAMQNFFMWAGLILFAMIITSFISFQSREGTGRRKTLRRAAAVLPAAMSGTFVLLFYVYSMSSASMAMEQMQTNAVSFSEAYESNSSLTSAVEAFYKDRYVDILKSSAEYLEVNGDLTMNPEVGSAACTYRSRDEYGNVTAVSDAFGNELTSVPENRLLMAIAEEMGQDRLMLFNASGRTVTSSDSHWYYEIKNCEEGFKEELFEVLDRRSSFFYRIEEYGEEGPQEMISYFAVPITLYMTEDDSGNTVYLSRQEYEQREKAEDRNIKKENGLLYAESKTPKLIYLSDRAVAEDTIGNMSPAQNSQLAVLTAKSGDYICSTANLSGQAVAALGFDGEEFSRETYRFGGMDGEQVFAGLVPIGTEGEYTLLTLLPCIDLFLGRLPVCFTGTFVLLAVLFMMSAYFLKNETDGETDAEQDRKLVLPQDERRYRSVSEYIGQMTSEEKTAGFFRVIVLIAFILMLIRVAGRTGTGSGSLVFHYTAGKTWKRELSLFSLSYAFYITVLSATGLFLLRKAVRYFVPILGTASETVVRLILSLLEYAAVIILIFYNLYLFGVQMGTVMTSAGIMTIVVGLGANSLIGDVLAGLFIIIEQEFKVGDIVTIGGFTGFVRSIGLRTTKIQDFSGNIKTFNNARIDGVMNLTDNYTTFFVTMKIDIDTSVEQIEDLVERDLKKRLEGNRDLVAGPWFSGIAEVGNRSYTISIGASSLQQKSWSLRKKIIQELLILLKEQNIRIS